MGQYKFIISLFVFVVEQFSLRAKINYFFLLAFPTYNKDRIWHKTKGCQARKNIYILMWDDRSSSSLLNSSKLPVQFGSIPKGLSQIALYDYWWMELINKEKTL